MEKVLEHAAKYNFLRKGDSYALSSLGTLLSDNIRQEWLNSVATSQPESVFRVSKICPAIYRECYELNGNKLPLGLVEMKDEDFRFSKMEEPRIRDLKMAFFSNPSMEMKWFDYWLRSRRAFWIKYLQHPELVSQEEPDVKISTLLKIELKTGRFDLETISRLGSDFFKDETDQKMFMTGGRKPSLPSVLEMSLSSHQILLAVLADGLTSRTIKKKGGRFLKIHPFLAPWKVGFILPSEKEASSQQLYELAMVLSTQLKTSRISVAPHRSGALDICSNWLDGAGVPFSVVLSETTLASGICMLRSRDTTISEQVHIGNLRPYLIKYLVPFVTSSKSE